MIVEGHRMTDSFGERLQTSCHSERSSACPEFMRRAFFTFPAVLAGAERSEESALGSFAELFSVMPLKASDF